MIFQRIDHDYTPCVTVEERAHLESVKQRLFYSGLGDEEIGDWLILNLARALFGGASKMKRILFCLARSNSGKTTLDNALMNSFGGYTETLT